MSCGPCSVRLTTPWQVLPKPLLPGSLAGFSWAPGLPHQICVLFPSPGSLFKEKVGHLSE